MKGLLIYLKEYKKETILGPLFKLLEASFELLVPFVVAAMIDVGIPTKDHTYIVKMALLLLLLAVVGLISAVTAQYFAAKAATGFAAKLRYALFEQIQKLSFSQMEEQGISGLITRMTSDINQVQTGVNMVIRLFLRSPFIVFGALIMAFTVDIRAAVIFVLIIPILFLIVMGILFFSIPLFKRIQEALDSIMSRTRENLYGVRVIRAFSAQEREIDSFQKEAENLQRLQLFAGRVSALMNPLTFVVVNGGLVALIYMGGIRVEAGVLLPGQVVALINYMAQILVELIKLANLIVTITKAIACGNRIEEVLKIPAGMKIYSEKTMKFESDTKEPWKVEFRNVSVRYHKNSDEALENLNLRVKKGEIIGVIGGTGSGKSTLVHLIPRFYDVTEGAVFIDGCDVRTMETEELRSKIGTVLQKANFFKGTIRENLLWGNQKASDEDLWEALKVAQGEEFVKNKEQKLDYMIEQEGRNLSGGQKQRLSIARALVKKPEILILDDSSSALDYATDLALRKGLKTLPKEMTVFIVSQRASSLMHADKIVVLDDGKVCGMGKHEELLKECNIYREIYLSQYEGGAKQ